MKATLKVELQPFQTPNFVTEKPWRTNKDTETWEKTEYYCPRCGKQAVFVEQGAGDYYAGPEHACTGCGSFFFMPSCCEADNEHDRQRMKQLSSPSQNGEHES